MGRREETIKWTIQNSAFSVNIWAQVVIGSEKCSQNVVPRPATLDLPGSFLEIQILGLHPRHPEPRKTEGGAQESVFRSPPGDSSAHHRVRTTGTEETPPWDFWVRKSFLERLCLSWALKKALSRERCIQAGQDSFCKIGKKERAWIMTALWASLGARCAAQVIVNSSPNRGSSVWCLLKWWHSSRKKDVSKVTELILVRTRIWNQFCPPPRPVLCLLCHLTVISHFICVTGLWSSEKL